MSKPHDKQFKIDAMKYRESHKDLTNEQCAKNLGIGDSTLSKWIKVYTETGTIAVIGSGKYATEEQKEIARLKRELRDTQDALDILKKAVGILGK